MRQYYQYFLYVIRHKWFVMTECFKAGLYWRGVMHDLSKLLPSEFIPYARYFYGNKGNIKRGRDNTGYYAPGETVDKAFNIAWLKHQHRNDHHWQYWILRLDDGKTTVFQMPHKAMLEMICDWKGAGRAINRVNDPKECKRWYLKNKKNMMLNVVTQTYIIDMFNR